MFSLNIIRYYKVNIYDAMFKMLSDREKKQGNLVEQIYYVVVR